MNQQMINIQHVTLNDDISGILCMTNGTETDLAQEGHLTDEL